MLILLAAIVDCTINAIFLPLAGILGLSVLLQPRFQDVLPSLASFRTVMILFVVMSTSSLQYQELLVASHG